MKITTVSYGAAFVERVNRAAGRAIVAIGVNVANETKRVTHVQSGTLRRSVHAAPASATHDDDETAAMSADLMLATDHLRAEEGDFGPTIEVGSWLPYACVEWVGRDHPGVTQGLEAVRGIKADTIVAQAFAEEGLSRLSGRRGSGGFGGSSQGGGGGFGNGIAGMIRRHLEHEAEG